MQYTGSSTITAPYLVDFKYGNRVDADIAYIAGSPVQELSRLPSTTLSYQAGSIGLQAEQSSGVAPAGGLQVMDINGDGRDDLAWSSTATSGTGTWMVAFANTSGASNAPINTGVANTNYSGAIPIDYNADGRADLLVPYSGTTWWVMLGSASGLAAPVNTGAPVAAN